MANPRFEGWRNRLHFLMRREEIVAIFCNLYKLQNPEIASFGI